MSSKPKWIGLAFFTASLIAIVVFAWGRLQQKAPFLRIPISFTQRGAPCIKTTIEGKNYILEFDSGSSGCFSLNQEIIDQIKNKTPTEPRIWDDLQGNEYTSSCFVVKAINIKTFKMKNIPVFAEQSDFLFNGGILNPTEKYIESLKKDYKEICGRIGIKTLRILDYWLIDLPHSSLVAIRNMDTIEQEQGFTFEGFTEVPMESIEKHPHIVISVETLFGTKKFAIDTGASRSLLRRPLEEFSNHQVVTTRCTIGNLDSEEIEFYLFDMNPAFPFDGLLGRDFLMRHAVYLDFKNKRVFIGPLYH